VENGGKFDGAVGVIGAIEAIRALNDLGIRTDYNLEVICFLGEEPNRFNMTTFGSKLLAGKLTDPRILDRLDEKGMTLGQALKEMGIDPAKIFEARYFPGQIRSFVELHIEQGNILYEKQIPIGIVTDVVAGYRYRVAFHGRADHSGTTPMHRRKDALAAAAEAILAVERICKKYGDKDIVGTVGFIRSTPGMMNVVPGYAEILMDIRGRYHFPKRKPAEEIKRAMLEISQNRQITVNIETLMEEESPALSEKVITVMRQCAEKGGYPYLLMPSRAGHDAMHLVDLTEVGMIFVPSKEGISHTSREWTDIVDVGKGVAFLADTLVAMATHTEG
jgi:N-carbamoyl-L-amino-acid hydrolase